MTSLKSTNDAASVLKRQNINAQDTLKMFDFHRNKSRIPVRVQKANYTKTSKPFEERSKEPVQFATHLLSFKENSKIPIYNPQSKQFDKQFSNYDDVEATIEEENEQSAMKKKVRFSHGREENFLAKNRKMLKLRGLELTSLPVEIFERKELESLILSPERESCLDFKLLFLPSAIGKLTNLRTLILDTNELQTIPEEIRNLHLLETLILSNNLLSDLPNGFESLDNLKSLHLANNNFTEMPQILCSLKSLGFLDMSDNEITVIPREISELSGSIHTLLLIMNNISSLPDSFCALTSLSSLWLGENELKTLPESFGDLFKLDWGLRPCSSNIDGNPLVHPPVEICQQGPSAIMKYFHDINEKKKTSADKKVKKDMKVSATIHRRTKKTLKNSTKEKFHERVSNAHKYK